MRPRPQPRREPEWVGIGSVPKPKRKPAKPRPLESEVQAAICDALAVLPVRVERMNSGKVKSRGGGWMQLHVEGTPDLMIMMFGNRVCFIEVKRDADEGLSKDQERVHKEYAAMGHEVCVCWDPMAALRFVNAQRLRGAL